MQFLANDKRLILSAEWSLTLKIIPYIQYMFEKKKKKKQIIRYRLLESINHI